MVSHKLLAFSWLSYMSYPILSKAQMMAMQRSNDIAPHLLRAETSWESTESDNAPNSKIFARKLEDYPRQYVLWKPEEIKNKVVEWKTLYPNLVRVTTSQEAYGLPRSGGPDDCPFDEGGDGCLHYIVTMQDFVAHPEGSDSSNNLPEVFWSGCVHGNERVGPTSVMESAALLLEATSCEARPHKPETSHKDGQFADELAVATSCRITLEQKGIDEKHRRWLARLMTTRRIVIIPTANALGYFQNKREEDGIDPNRDFPLDVQDKHLCMQTIAGRTINEVFREHMFQLALTFHGGTEVVGYEWGAPSFLHNWSPDDAAQAAIAHSYSRYGSGWPQSQPYDVGTMNDKVYYVRGGMEDWAYCGSWIPEVVIQCEPLTYDEYPQEKTIYNNATLRAFNMLVETSNQKIPPTNMLGNSKDVLIKETEGNGHISRNVRLALLSADLVEPYVSIVAVNELALSDDIVPLIERNCQTSSKRVLIPQNLDQITVEWTVGGSLEIDETSLWVAKSFPQGAVDCLTQPLRAEIESSFVQISPDGATDGLGYFAESGPRPHPSVSNTDTEPSLGPIFSAVVDVSALSAGETLTVIVSGRVDRSWASKPSSNVKPDLPPQAHIVNARTNPDWYFESAGKQLKGRLDWFSLPITIVVGDYADNVGQDQAGRQISTIEVSNRFGRTTGPGGAAPFVPPTSSSMNRAGYIGAGLIICLLAGTIFLLSTHRRGAHIAPSEAEEEEDTWNHEPYSDEQDLDKVEMKVYNDDPLFSDEVVQRYTIH